MPRILSMLIAMSALGTASLAASAADMPQPRVLKTEPAPTSASGWTFQFTPYLWASGLKGDVSLGPNLPTVGVDVSFDDILDHLKFAAMGEFETRYGRFGFISDISYLAVEVSATGPLGFVNAKLEDKTFFGTFAGAYRLSEQPSGWFDIVGGARVWWRRDALTITGPGPIGVINASREESWVDPVIGMRARVYLTPQFYAQFYGDYGGFSVGARSDWQVQGILGYQYSTTTSFFAGYRYLSVDYNRDGYVFDVNLSGPIVGASFRF